jgi:hypothetical protein
MRKPRIIMGAPPYPSLAGLRCSRCGALGVSVVAMAVVEGSEPRERLWCTPDCARGDGWPWLRSEPKVAVRRKARSAASPRDCYQSRG